MSCLSIAELVSLSGLLLVSGLVEVHCNTTLRGAINERRQVLYLPQGEGYLYTPLPAFCEMKSPVGDEDGALVFPLKSALGLGDGLDRISPEGAILREGQAYIDRDELIPDPDSGDILTFSPASLAAIFKGGTFHIILAEIGAS